MLVYLVPINKRPLDENQEHNPCSSLYVSHQCNSKECEDILQHFIGSVQSGLKRFSNQRHVCRGFRDSHSQCQRFLLYLGLILQNTEMEFLQNKTQALEKQATHSSKHDCHVHKYKIIYFSLLWLFGEDARDCVWGWKYAEKKLVQIHVGVIGWQITSSNINVLYAIFYVCDSDSMSCPRCLFVEIKLLWRYQMSI